MFSKILVANRGEIAVRVINACRELGIRTVAVYSEADEDSLHVRLADEAHPVGPAPATESYLAIDKVMGVAQAAGAEAVHPGYGFLAENPEFARRVLEAGMVWVGPSPDVIKLLGDKVESKVVAERAGLRTVPGYRGDDLSLPRVQAAAQQIGYPLMIKATAGGGGKGMRAVLSEEQLPQALEGAQREAKSAFGDGRVFLEKLLERPRHIEVQILADARGNVLHLGERECSIQRRHQKVIEEAPSPVITADLRAQMGEAAVRLAREVGYTNAGTVEFLFSDDTFYFLEVNTRIQVEHPVTEMVTGFDLVREQLRVAAGEPLRSSQLAVEWRGHAIEARIYAEDPAGDFLPSTGTLALFQPAQGTGVRNDIGVTTGSVVTPYYDPMLAKLIVHAKNRGAAVERLRRALAGYLVLGVTTNVDYLLRLAGTQEFVTGRMDVGLLDRLDVPGAEVGVPDRAVVAAAVYQTMARHSGDKGLSPWQQPSGNWRPAGLWRTFRYVLEEREYEVRLRPAGDHLQVRIGDQQLVACGQLLRPHLVRLELDGEARELAVEEDKTAVTVSDGHRVYPLRAITDLGSPRDIALGSTTGGLSAPMPGTVVKVAVAVGDQVVAHQPLVVLEAMKMEHVIEAPHDGTVEALLYGEGDMVPAGSPVASLME